MTGISGKILTVERAQEGTSAQNWNVGDFIWNGPTAGTALLQNTVDPFTSSGLITANGGIVVPSGQTITLPNATANNEPVALGQFSNVLAAPGYQKFPNGLLIQWGSISVGATSIGSVNFPIVFPTGTVTASVTWGNGSFTTNPPAGAFGNFITTSSYIQVANSGNNTGNFFYIAIGY